MILTRRKFIVGLAVATPIAIAACESQIPPNTPTSERLTKQTLNDIITVNAHGQKVSRSSSTITYFTEPMKLPNGAVPLEMALIPKGKFMMGAPSSEKERRDSESPQHEVNFPQEFYMGRYAVTQAQWLAVMGQFTDAFNKSADVKFKGDNRPMIYVSWAEAREFCKRLTVSLPANRGIYRLPTEAEWEYACRAGTTTPFHFGESITTDLANYDGSPFPYANVPKREGRKQTVDVNQFSPNAWGLHQMHGNVYEWCLDEYIEYKNKSDNLKNNGSEPYGDINKSHESSGSLLRGGSWNVPAIYCRSAIRFVYSKPDESFGFRLLLSSSS